MQVSICNGCNKQHDTEDIKDKYINICDGCKQEFGKSKKYSCLTCDNNNQNYNEPEYHKSCVTSIDDMWYCNVHKVAKEKAFEAGMIVQKYAQEFWSELGGTVVEFKQTDKSLNRNFKVQFEALRLEVKLSAVTKPNADDDTIREDIVTTDEIIALNHNVSGIKSYGSKMYRVGIHSHQDALQEVAEAMIRSLRSKKSALTQDKNWKRSYYDRRRIEYKEQKAKKKEWQALEAECKQALNAIATKRRKINKMSNFLIGKLAELKKAREEKKQLEIQQSETVLI